ncbi:hypothetical protein DQW50_16235 [Halorubrum sp. 48-1-W]|nr:hypothetical protein DQW50_16235 [Halorubrum sp. 48-1-W]
MRRHLRRLYADRDGLLPACPACDDRCEHVAKRGNISLSMRRLEARADDARLPREQRLADRIAEVAGDD